MATVTILLPTYERPRYLEIAIASALAQSYGDFVLSIGDNGANSDAEHVVRNFDDARIRYVRRPENLGAMGNWLALLRDADTPLVATLHDDDAWHEDLLATLVPPMVNDRELAMAYGDFWLMDHEGNRLTDMSVSLSTSTHRDRLPEGRCRLDRDQGVRLIAVWNAPQPTICAVVRRDLLTSFEYPDEFANVSDLWTSYQMVLRESAIWYVPRRLADYRWHSGSLTLSADHASEDAMFARLISENKTTPLADELLHRWATIRWGRAVHLLRRGRSARAHAQQEFLAAAPGLRGRRHVVAASAGQSATACTAWRGVQWVGDFVSRRACQP